MPPRPAYTYRGARRKRHFRDGFKFIRLRGDNWRQPFEEKLRQWTWPRRMHGFFYKHGGRTFWNRLRAQFREAQGKARPRQQATARASKQNR